MRFEYALKAMGYHRGDGDALPDWDRFAQSVEAIFREHPTQQFEAAVKYLVDNTPKKQIIKDGKLEWKASYSEAESIAVRVILYIRHVRNNLFHGGKVGGYWFEPQRSRELLEHSLAVLEVAVGTSLSTWGRLAPRADPSVQNYRTGLLPWVMASKRTLGHGCWILGFGTHRSANRFIRPQFIRCR